MGLLANWRSTRQKPDTARERSRAAAAARKLNQGQIEAIRAGDPEWFQRNMAEDSLVILGEGERLTKPDFLSHLASRIGDELVSFKTCDGEIRVFGSTVQVDTEMAWTQADRKPGRARYLSTYVNLDGQWKLASLQVTPVSMPSDATA